jgi:hypothetical protein
VNEDTTPLIAKQPEHCHQCYRLIPTGETYYETPENTGLCDQCAAVEPLDTIQASGALIVEICEEFLTVRGGVDELQSVLE